MAIIRTYFVTTVLLLCVLFSNAQTVKYPALSSQLLKSTAADAAMLLNKSVTGSQFTVSVYTSMPQTGVIFIYDSSITDYQACKVESDGANFIKFSAAEDNGLCFGFYQYLQTLGFKFYQPGSIWEAIPSLASAYKKLDSVFTFKYKYNGWLLSGGHNRWIMDSSPDYGWDVCYGDNGHNWSLYQRRNGMTGVSRFQGHRGDMMSGAYFAALQNNPCYVAPYNNSRVANTQSVPDVNNTAAKELWANTLEQKYTQYKNNIYSNTSLYVNHYRNFNYNYKNVGIEVPDAAQWANSTDNQGCSSGAYKNESDQQFTLANYTAQKINGVYPGKKFQVYAYSTHADVPSPAIALNNNIDIQLVPTVYQNITSTNGLRNRWYKRTGNISEYSYLNLSGWSGETPAFSLDEFKATVQIAKDKKSQGLLWETSPAKFASLPYLYAANNSLLHDVSIDNTLQEFCDNMFADASNTVYELLNFWADGKNMAGGSSNKYKIPVYLQMLEKANQQTKNAPEIVKARLRELKAYLHYMILYFDWSADQKGNDVKIDKAAKLCMYLAKTNRMQLVNSYYMIATITWKYVNNTSFYQQYNITNGTAYQNGNLPLITAVEIESDFVNDLATYTNGIENFYFENAMAITSRLTTSADIIPQQKINVQLKYTNGIDNYNRSEFFINAPKAGKFSIAYKPSFDRPDKGYINFLAESVDRPMDILEDFTIDQNAPSGTLTVVVPSAGFYKLTVASKYQSSVELNIDCNSNVFFKSGSFFGKATEIYKNNIGIPGYFYTPTTTNKVYFSISNSYHPQFGFISAERVNTEFEFKDNKGNVLKARFVTPSDSALFYIDIPAATRGGFCSITKKSNYGLVFSNISNYLWYAQPKPLPCADADFTVAVVNNKGNCTVQLTAVKTTGNFQWEVTDLGRTTSFTNQRVIKLPANSSPNAQITLINGNGCSNTKRLRDDGHYTRGMQACAVAAPLPQTTDATVIPALYPNPSTGSFMCLQKGVVVQADEIAIVNLDGALLASFSKVSQFNIRHLPAGIYRYKMLVKGAVFNGKIVKL